MNENKLVEVRELKKYYMLDKHTTVKAVDDVSFDILKANFWLVGESGSGKSTTGKALMHLFERPVAPSVLTAWKFQINLSTGKTAGALPEKCR